VIVQQGVERGVGGRPGGELRRPRRRHPVADHRGDPVRHAGPVRAPQRDRVLVARADVPPVADRGGAVDGDLDVVRGVGPAHREVRAAHLAEAVARHRLGRAAVVAGTTAVTATSSGVRRSPGRRA